MKNNQFDNYSHDELEAQRRVITAGYLIITIASFLAMAFFVTHNMIGTSKPIWDAVNGLNWGFGQLAYLFISVGFAFGFNAFTYFFYQMELNAKQRAFVLFVAIAFPMFAEVGQSMTRAEDTRHEAATNSEAFKIMASRVKNAGVTSDTGISSAMAAAMAEKAKAQTELAACTRYTVEARRQRCERIETGNIAAAQAKAEGFQMAGSASITASSSQLKQDAGMLKELEADDGFLQPIVRLLMSFGIPAIGASFLIAFLIIGSMEVAMAYLGGLLRQLKDRMRALGIAVSSNKIKARYVDGVSYTRESSPSPLSNVSAPMSAFTNGANSARQTVGEFAQKVEAGLKASPEIIATEYARAQHGHNQAMEAIGHAAGKVGSKLDELAGKPDQDVMNEMLKIIRTQLLNGELEPTVKALYPAIEKALDEAGYETPKKTVTKLAENLLAHLAMKDNVLVKRGGEYQLSERYKSGSDLFPPALQETDSFKQSPEQKAFVMAEFKKQTDEYERKKQAALSGENTVKYLTPRLSVEETVKAIQSNVKASGATSPDAIQAAVFDAFAAMPNPAPLSDAILERIAEKLAEKNAEKAIPTTAPSVPFHQQSGATGIHNPVLGTAEEHFPLPLPVTESRDLTPSRDLNPVTGHGESVTAVTESVTDEEKVELLEKMAMLEQKLDAQKAEMEAQAARDLESRSRMEANAQAKLEADKVEKKRAEKARAERDRLRDLEIRSRAEAAEKEARSREAEIRSRAEAAAEQAARDLAAAEQAARDLAERGSVTDEQIELATTVIRAAIVTGRIEKVGSPQTIPILKAEGLPTTNDTLKTLSKFACRTLENEGLVIRNPNKGVGQPLYLIA